MKTFEELGVSAPICQAVSELGYAQPMPVQEAVIPYLLGEPIDLVALAQTGTGKTAAFGLPLLQKLSQYAEQSVAPRALVLCPTRELCLQIADDLVAYSKYLPNVRILPVYGGSSIEAQIRTLKRGVEVIVATPGRLIDLMERGAASLAEVRTVILDEADEMLNMGFADSLKTILAEVPEERHLLLFSATMPREIASIAKSYMRNPQEIVVGNKNEGNANIKHVYYMVAARHKYLALKRIADYYPNIYGIVFCRTRKETQEIADQLIKDGYNADSLHGELSQAQRDYVMQKFRIRNLQILVATDVAARGLDVNDLTHVIHYGLPDDIESYTHRSGRTARAGKTGLSIAICHSRERGRLRDIERIINSKIERVHMPSGRDICEKQLYNLADRIERVDMTEDATLESFLPGIVRKLDWLDKEELLRRLMLMEFRRLLDYYESVEEIEEADDKGRLERSGESSKTKRERGAEPGMTRLFINFGKMDRMFPNKLIELINKCVPGRVKIGKIDLLPRFSFFDVDEHDAQEVVDSMNRYEVEGRRISVEFADKAPVTARGARATSPRGERKASRGAERGSDRGERRGKRSDGESWGDERASARKARKGRGDAPFYDRYAKKRK
ncbi:MAG: DEAD/DEAH box helicase [Porphyromonadaceae bacterium]|nr:DEAD/DEAH box helicase [Porphyromonadaceae bacterium]